MEAAGLAVGQTEDPLPDGLQLVGGRHPVGGYGPHTRRLLLQKPRHPHLEELVQIRRVDGEELGSLQQGGCRILGDREDTLVEVEPGELTIGIPIRHWPSGLTTQRG